MHPYGITNAWGIAVLWTLQEVTSIIEPQKGERKAVFSFFKIILHCLIKFVCVWCHYFIQDSTTAVEANEVANEVVSHSWQRSTAAYMRNA